EELRLQPPQPRPAHRRERDAGPHREQPPTPRHAADHGRGEPVSDEHGSSHPADPTSLPLFAAPGPSQVDAAHDEEISQRLAAGAGSVSPHARHVTPEQSPPPPGWGRQDEAPVEQPPSSPGYATVPAQRLDRGIAHDTEVDWAQVADLRGQASEMLTGALQDRGHLEPEAQRELGRSIIV